MITIILTVVVVLIGGFLVVAARQPADCHIKRSTTVSAARDRAFAYVNDLQKWQQISPYVKLDLAAEYTFTGPPAGIGASLAWTGNRRVGEGRITITESRPGELVRMKLEMVRPFTCTNTVEFTFQPAGDQTAVTWGMFCKNNFLSKAMGLIMNMDRMCGRQFEEGLANLKSLAESATETPKPALC